MIDAINGMKGPAPRTHASRDEAEKVEGSCLERGPYGWWGVVWEHGGEARAGSSGMAVVADRRQR